MKRKWWIIPVVILAAIGISLCFFGVRIRLFPRLVLSGGLNRAVTYLESRFENSPLHLLKDVIDPEGCYQAELQAETELDYVGLVRYDMQLQTQMKPLRIEANGAVVTGGKVLDLSLYLDRDFAAVSSDGLVDGNYYGITYDSFSQDIRSRELLAVLIGEDTISQWEAEVSSLADAMSAEMQQPEFSVGDIRTALYAVLALKPQVSRQEMDISGDSAKVYAVTFETTGSQIGEAVQPHRDELPPQLSKWIDEIEKDPDFYVRTTFFLDQRELVKLETHIQYSGGSSVVKVALDKEQELEPLELGLETKKEDNLNRIRVCVKTVSGADSYQEEILMTKTQNGVQSSGTMNYDYDLSTGEMDLCVVRDGKKAEAKVHLAGEGEHLTITTQNAASLLNLFREKNMESPVIVTLSISPGRPVVTPAYRNLDQWSMEDLWTLLKGLGSLVGLQLP